MRRKIADIVGVDPFGRAASPTVAGIVRRQGDTLVANISLEQRGEATTTRGFQSNDITCGPLSEAVALAVALSVERSLMADAAQPPDKRLSPEPETRAWPLREAQRSRSWLAQAQALWTLGLLPRATTGLGAAVHYRVTDRFAAVLGGMWMPAASEGGQFSVGLQAARLGGCVETFRVPPLALVGCAYGLAGAMQAKNETGTLSNAGAHTWVAASMSALASAKLGESWFAEAGAEGAVPFARPTYQTMACPLVGFQQPAATLGVFLSLGVLFL